MRIGINIPDDLLKRFEPLRSQINISQVCREAIQAMVEKYERNIVRLEENETQRSLQKVSHQELEWMRIVEVDWERMGYDDAVDWVRAAGWEDWQLRHRVLEVSGRRGQADRRIQRPLLGGKRHLAKVFDDRLAEYFDKISEQNEQSEEFVDWRYNNNLYIDVQTAERVYDRAWSAYVQAAWDKMQRMKDEYNE